MKPRGSPGAASQGSPWGVVRSPAHRDTGEQDATGGLLRLKAKVLSDGSEFQHWLGGVGQEISEVGGDVLTGLGGSAAAGSCGRLSRGVAGAVHRQSGRRAAGVL